MASRHLQSHADIWYSSFSLGFARIAQKKALKFQISLNVGFSTFSLSDVIKYKKNLLFLENLPADFPPTVWPNTYYHARKISSLQMLAGRGLPQSRPSAALRVKFPLQLGQKVRVAGGLRPRLQVTASARSSGADSIFNRKEELAALNSRFEKNPSELLILLGPANCGKSVSFFRSLFIFCCQSNFCD